MKIHLMSDLHLDHYKDQGNDFLDGLKGGADVCVLAGDIGTARFPDQLRKVFRRCAELYPYVVYVPGNHEFYRTTPTAAWHNIRLAATGLSTVHILDKSSVEIMGRRFLGGTMWFRNTEDARCLTALHENAPEGVF
jgi:predicted phosphodiesterase